MSRRNRTTRDGDDDGHDACHILSVSGGFCRSHLHTKTSVERKVKRSWCFSFIGTILVITHPGGMRSLVAVACFCTTFERRLQGETQGVLVEQVEVKEGDDFYDIRSARLAGRCASHERIVRMPTFMLRLLLFTAFDSN